MLTADTIRMPLNLPAQHVTWIADPATEAALHARTAAHWTRLGLERLHFSVTGADIHDPAAFAASGEHDTAILTALLARHGRTPASLPRALEFGCGTGRMTLPLRRHFPTLTAADISVPHLTLARARAGAGVTFALVTPPAYGMTAPYDFWFSTLTLQHNPPPLIAAILRRAFALLAPGGLAIFQLPTERAGYAYSPAMPDGAEDLPIHILPQPAIFALAAAAGCIPLEVREDCAIWPPTEIISNRFVFLRPTLP